MAGQTVPNDPVGLVPSDKVRQLQRQLWAAAKRAPGRRLHALYEQMCRDDVLHEAWKRVRRNKGAAGVDRVTINEVEQDRVRRFLQELGEVLTEGREGFDFLGCHLHNRMSGWLWQQKGLRRYYLQRWPSHKAMSRVRERVRALTPRGRCHQDVRGVIAELNPVLRGWGQYFRTGNAANHFIAVEDCVVRRLQGLRLQRAGRTLGAGQAQRWGRDHFERLGLHRLRGTIRYLGKPPGYRRAA